MLLLGNKTETTTTTGRGGDIIARLPKRWMWVLLSLPAAIILLRYALDRITYGKVIHETGLWSAGLLAVALLVTPLRKLFPTSVWVRGLLRHRRAVGVASFGYAALHTVVYLEYKALWARIVAEGSRMDLLTGWLALLIFAILAVTSNDVSVRRLRRNWKRLHRSVYLATGLLFAHWYLAAFDARPALYLAGVLGLAQVARLALSRRRGV